MLVNGKSGSKAKYALANMACTYLSRDAKKAIKHRAKKSVKQKEKSGWKKQTQSEV